MYKFKTTVFIIFRVTLLISTIAIFTACAQLEKPEDHVFTLYRNSVIDENMRLHIATFDANESEEYNRENCDIVQQLFQNQFGVKTKYWCEKGRYNK